MPREAPIEPKSRVWHPVLGKTTATLLVMALVLSAPYASPHLRVLRILRAPWDQVPSETTLTQAVTQKPVLLVGEQTLGATENQETPSNALPNEKGERVALDPAALAKVAGSLAVEDPTGHALDAFYASLAKTIAKEPGAVTRILHYGDSVITADLISGTMRRLTQAKFGDSGHGFILIANPWEWYFHNDVSHRASEGWTVHRITGPLSGDGLYGLGGVSFRTGGAASAWFSTKSDGDYGRKASRFDVFYLEQPWGGDLMLVTPGRPAERLKTRGPKRVSRVHSVSVPDGPAQLTLRTWGNGDVRLFGVAIERDVPGVVYDALGANGARLKLWDFMSKAHWAEQFALRNPALIVLQYGTNESEDEDFKGELYGKALDEVLTMVREAAPEASILVAAPLDRGERGEGGKIRTKPIIPRLLEMQRKAALAHGLAFWNTFEAMGGDGAMGRWMKADPPLAGYDFTHPTPLGAEVIADLLFKALTTGYTAYASTHDGSPPLPN
jgi:lysophospholipase L1-like esterase